MEDLCESVFIRVPLFLCVLCASEVKKSSHAGEGFADLRIFVVRNSI